MFLCLCRKFLALFVTEKTDRIEYRGHKCVFKKCNYESIIAHTLKILDEVGQMHDRCPWQMDNHMVKLYSGKLCKIFSTQTQISDVETIDVKYNTLYVSIRYGRNVTQWHICTYLYTPH